MCLGNFWSPRSFSSFKNKLNLNVIKDNEINSYNITDFFLIKSVLTPKKIQKLVYYAYS